MALIKCSECGKEISDKAAACVHCGCPISVNAPKAPDTVEVQKIFRELFSEGAKSLSVNFNAILSGAENERSQQSVFVEQLGRRVEFSVPNSIQIGQSVRVSLQNDTTYRFVQFNVASVKKASSVSSAAASPANSHAEGNAIETIKKYKPNLLVRFFKSRIISKIFGMFLAFIILGHFDGVDVEILLPIIGLGVLFILGNEFYPIANIKKYYKKNGIDEAIRNDTGYMNVAIVAFNALPTKKMLAYIKKLNPPAAQEIKRQQAESKKK